MKEPYKADFTSPQDPSRRIVFNRDPLVSVILKVPKNEELAHVLRDVERTYVDSFWQQVLCRPSPYSSTLPLALAYANHGVTLVTPSKVVAAAATLRDRNQPENEKFGTLTFSSAHPGGECLWSEDDGQRILTGRQQVSDYSRDELTRALQKMKPKTIRDAEACLNHRGQGKLATVSVLELYSQHTDAEAFLHELTKVALEDGGKALMLGALVAARSNGWVVLPGEVIDKMAIAVRTARAKDREWSNPMNFLSQPLRLLYDELCLPAGVESGPKRVVAESKARFALLSTNLESKEDMSWPLASEIVSKQQFVGQGFDPPFAIRNHWRQICRANGARSTDRHEAATAAEAPGFETAAWPSAEPSGLPESRIFRAPHDPKYEVTLNWDYEKPHIVHHAGREELLKVATRVEHDYIGQFWEQLCAASPHISELPYALAASLGGHTLLPPSAVYAQITGHNDVSSSEALCELRRYPMSELRAAVQKLKPSSINAALGLLSENGRVRFHGFSLVDMIQDEPTFTAYVLSLVKVASDSGFGTCKGLAQHALVALRSKGWIILPESVNQHIGRVLRGVHGANRDWAANPMSFLDPHLQELYTQLLGEAIAGSEEDTAHPLQQCVARRAILCTNVRSARDLSMPLVEAILATDAQSKANGIAAVPPAALRARWQRLCEENGPAAMRLEAKKNDHRGALAKRCSTTERLDEWLDFMANQAELHTGGNLEPLYGAFGHWLAWLLTLEVIPKPMEISRKHIRDDASPSANTFRAYLSRMDWTVTRSRNHPLAKMNQVFGRLSRESEESGATFHNPIQYDHDRFPVPRQEKCDGTKRKSMAEWIMAELRELIVKDKGDGNYAWGEDLQGLDCLQLETGKDEKVFCPVLPAIIYLMLVFPLRTHAARWIDSGEMDELIYDSESKGFVPNPDRPIPGRDCGVIQPSQSKPIDDKGVPDLEFQVSVNKTLLQQRNRSAFTIPYLPADVLWIIKQVLAWQKRYGPPAHLVKEVHEPTIEQVRNQGLAAYYPDICPLFRYPKQESFYPPAHSQIARFWGKLCRLWDDKNASWDDPKTGQCGKRPGAPKLSRLYTPPDGRSTHDVAVYDLHSLRVSRVTVLLDAGLPLGVVSAIAGHKSLAMTLHYYSAERHTLKVKLHEAFQKLGSDAGMEEIAKRLYDTDDESWLRGSPDGFARLRQNRRNGLMSITTSGICPAASCDTGMIDPARPSELPSEVPGSRCPLCRYFIYGPAFLPGLAYDYNCLLFELEKKANQHVRLRMDAIAAEDAGNRGDVWRLRGEDDRLDRETTLDLRVLGRLYVMIEECISLINEGGAAGPQSVALFAPSNVRLVAVMERVSKFQQLKDLIEVAQIIPSSRHTAPIIAEIELKDRLLDFLRRNGAECYLAGIPKDAARVATLQLARLLERLVPVDDSRQDLLDGVTKLCSMPEVEADVLSHIEKSKRQIEAGSGDRRGETLSKNGRSN